jgi:hypothetical protein
MNFGAAAVSHELTMSVVEPADGSRSLPVVMHYDLGDPFAVCLEFHTGGGQQVAWVFGRELLTLGLLAPAGEGDVRVWPSPGRRRVFIALCSPEGEAVVEAEICAVESFLARSYAVCPPGAEASHLDVEATLRSLFAL